MTLLTKGLRSNPTRWEYYQDIGFVHYWWTGDYAQAADAFSKGAAVAGAPWWMKSLAAVTVAKGGDRATSRVLWRALAQTPDNDFLRRDAQRRLVQLDALDQIDELTGRRRSGACRRAFGAVVVARAVPAWAPPGASRSDGSALRD